MRPVNNMDHSEPKGPLSKDTPKNNCYATEMTNPMATFLSLSVFGGGLENLS